MQPELALKAISYTVIGIFLVTLLSVLLISLRKELSGEAPVRGVFQFGLVIIGLCTVVALMAAYFQARKMVRQHFNAQRLDTTSVSQSVRRQHEYSRTLGLQLWNALCSLDVGICGLAKDYAIEMAGGIISKEYSRLLFISVFSHLAHRQKD